MSKSLVIDKMDTILVLAKDRHAYEMWLYEHIPADDIAIKSILSGAVLTKKDINIRWIMNEERVRGYVVEKTRVVLAHGWEELPYNVVKIALDRYACLEA